MSDDPTDLGAEQKQYQVEFTSAAARQVKKLPRPARERVLGAIANLAEHPLPHGVRKLAGEEIAWRIRVGECRVIYELVDTAMTVTVIRAGHRRDVYQ